MIKIAVVIPVLNQFKYAIDALESIKTQNLWTPFIIPNYRAGQSVSASWNIGTRQAIFEGYTHILIINDDVVIGPYTVDHLVNIMNDNPDIGVITGTDYRWSYSPDEMRGLEFPGHTDDITNGPDFACFMITPESYEAIGEFDEEFSPAYFEDNDYTYRAYLIDRPAVRSLNGAFYHYGSQTQNSTGKQIVPPKQFLRNKKRYIEKWGGEPDHELFKTPFNKG